MRRSRSLCNPLLSFLDDTNFVVQPERVRPVLDLLAAALWRHARIQLRSAISMREMVLFGSVATPCPLNPAGLLCLVRHSVPPRLLLLSCSACPPATPACSSASVALRICRLRGCCCCSARALGATMCFGCSSLASLRLLLLLMTQPCWTVCRTCCSAALCQLSPLVSRSFPCAWGVSACVLLLLQPPPLTGLPGPIVCPLSSVIQRQLPSPSTSKLASLSSPSWRPPLGVRFWPGPSLLLCLRTPMASPCLEIPPVGGSVKPPLLLRTACPHSCTPSLTVLPVACLCRSRARLLVGCSLSFRSRLSCRSLRTCSVRSPFGGSDSPFPSPIALAGAVAASTPLATTAQRAPGLGCCRAAVALSSERPLGSAASARVTVNSRLADMNLPVDRLDDRRLEVVANGPNGAQVAVDNTLVSPLSSSGEPCRHAGRVDGAALREARRRKERTYPELLRSQRCRSLHAGPPSAFNRLRFRCPLVRLARVCRPPGFRGVPPPSLALSRLASPTVTATLRHSVSSLRRPPPPRPLQAA